MNVKLIALDMDGTTLQNDHLTISDRTQRAMKTAIERGIIVVPATGRLDSLLPQCVMDIPGIRYAITSNGAVTYDMQERKILNSSFMKAELAAKVLNVLPLDRVLVEIFGNGSIYSERKFMQTLSEYPISFLDLKFLRSITTEVDDLAEYIRDHGDNIEKINLPYIPPEWRSTIKERLSKLDSVAVTSSIAHNAEVNSEEADKGAALKKLCDSLQISRENVIAMGDNGNDITMLKFAGLSAAMGNGTQEAKSAASVVTLPNEEDGVAVIIEKYALNS